MDSKDPHRKPGILNERRRKYLLDRLDLDDSNERKIRGEIRNKTMHALLDFELLNEVQEGDLRQIMELDTATLRDELGAPIEGPSGSQNPSDGGSYRFEQLYLTPSDKHAFRNPYLEDSMVQVIRFLFRLAEIENIPIDSFIENVIPEAYREYSDGDGITVTVEKEPEAET